MCLSPEELTKCIYLSLNPLAPAYEGVELGIGMSQLPFFYCMIRGKDFFAVTSHRRLANIFFALIFQ